MAARSRKKDAYKSFFLLIRQLAFGFVSLCLALSLKLTVSQKITNKFIASVPMSETS